MTRPIFLIPPSRIRSLTHLPHTRSAISSTLTLGDFTMAPDIRMSPPALDDNDIVLKHVLVSATA